MLSDEVKSEVGVVDALRVEAEVMRDDIIDFIEEISDDDPIEIIPRLEQKRSEFRSIHYKLKHHLKTEEYSTSHLKDFEYVISRLKDCIRDSRDFQSKCRLQDKIIADRHAKAHEFQLQTTEHSLSEFEEIFKRVVWKATENDLVKWDAEKTEVCKRFDSLSDCIQKLIKYPTENEDSLSKAELLGERYDKLISLKRDYLYILKKEIEKQELTKEDLSKEAKLNIKLPKFSGYDSELDVYSFQSEFEKLHSRTISKRLLPDLLINNYLSEPALSLVKGLDDIKEVWKRLHATYGDTKMLLKKKLSKLDKLDALWRTKDPVKLVSALYRIINTMKDLLCLVEKHNIEQYLFYGDGLTKIYKLMGDVRVMKWFEQSCNKEMVEKTKWEELMVFLEKEIKVQQQKIMFSNADGDSKDNSSNQRYNKSFLSDSLFNNNGIKSSEFLCSFCGKKCGEADHVASSGPGGSKIIQYFSCKEFVDKTPAERFSIIKRKGFCFQCLLPGAKRNRGKHKEGKCQHDFVCPHPYHERYPVKTHILLCEKHKDSFENQELLTKYKSRCILRHTNLPSFSSEIKLSFHALYRGGNPSASLANHAVSSLVPVSSLIPENYAVSSLVSDSSLVPENHAVSSLVPDSSIVPENHAVSSLVPDFSLVPQNHAVSSLVPDSSIVPENHAVSSLVPDSSLVPENHAVSSLVPDSSIVPENHAVSSQVPDSSLVPKTSPVSQHSAVTSLPISSLVPNSVTQLHDISNFISNYHNASNLEYDHSSLDSDAKTVSKLDYVSSVDSTQNLVSNLTSNINNELNVLLHSPSISFTSKSANSSSSSKPLDTSEEILHDGIYLLQRIKVNDQIFSIFYDNGCSDFIITKDAIKRLGSNAIKISDGPSYIGGIGDTFTEASFGMYKIKLRLLDGTVVSLSGSCVDKITSPFPVYLLDEAEKDLIKAAGIKAKTFPKLPKSVGGNIDIMIGSKYLRYHPKPIFENKLGLTIFRSVFRSADGTTGVIGGPHKSFDKKYHLSFLSDLKRDSDTDLTLLGFKATPLESFDNAENAGIQINYRCVKCRNCQDCKVHDKLETVSIREEAEQSLINSSIMIDLQNNSTSAKLPFICNPVLKLAPNKCIALKVYNQQIKKLNQPSNLKDKEDILLSEAKLQKLGYVDYLKNLPEETQIQLKNHEVQNYIPWRAVWKTNSVSTPCRIVFDGSQATPSGLSINDVLAKGRNNLNRLQEIMIRWCLHSVGIHTDISKMYNTVHLDESHWCFQRYIWEKDLDPTKIPEQKVIKTLIYGIKSSGNQSEHALREVARLSSEEFPDASNVIRKDIYVDDCMSGRSTLIQAKLLADDLELVLNRGGFRLKGVCFSGEAPSKDLSDDSESIFVGGMRWFTEPDLLSLNVSDLNFSRKKRGKKSQDFVDIIPHQLTKRQCASRLAEVFDLLGKVTPITAGMKLDLHELTVRKLDWDDVIPESLREIWLSNFEMIKEIQTIKFKRTVIPPDAVSCEVETIDTADASQALACAAIYARVKRKNGKYSCQLVFSRSKLIPANMSQPRAELFAATMNAHTGEIVRRSFGKFHSSSIKLSDSQIALHWISNQNKPLKQWVRNRVIEINRFTNTCQWFYVQSKDMAADIATRKGATIEDIHPESVWLNGYEWMRLTKNLFPITPVSALKLSCHETAIVQQEVIIQHQAYASLPNQVADYYLFSDYLIDPNRYQFSKVVRILAYVIKFIKNCRRKPMHVDHVSLLPIEEAETYFFKICTREIKNFLPKSCYNKISFEKDGIIYYTGRILSNDDITIIGKFTKSMKDLSELTFCVPMISKYSPVAYAIISEIHWYDSAGYNHRGTETTLRQCLRKAFILEARSIIKSIKKSCPRCRILEKKVLEVSMGPVSKYNLTIAPPFFNTQTDLSGPYKAYSPHNRRSTIKIWLVVFCCCTTSCTSIKVMDNYSTESFIQAFVRFSSDVGFPNRLLCDEGSQLVKACKEMKLCFKDLNQKLHRDVSVAFETCPVGGHNMNGKVERKIREIKRSIERSTLNERLSLLQWETMAAQISNSLNNLPLALGNVTSDFEALDLLTPNRLRLGRNNDRSPVGEMVMIDHPKKILLENQRIFNSWFEVWLMCHVPKLMNQEKWFNSDDQLNKGDVVLFLKQESSICKDYQYGMVEDIEFSNDGRARKVQVKYRNSNETAIRYTRRAVRSLVLIKPADEIDLITELGMAAENANSTLRHESSFDCNKSNCN